MLLYLQGLISMQVHSFLYFYIFILKYGMFENDFTIKWEISKYHAKKIT